MWRELDSAGGILASRDPLTNSFIPNLVWLPVQVSKLTDREGSFAQRFLQALAIKIYRSLPLDPPLLPLVERAWRLLPDPGRPEIALPGLAEVSFFNHDPQFVRRRVRSIQKVAAALQAQGKGREIEGKVISSRYTSGLAQLDGTIARRLHGELSAYLEAVAAD